MNTEKLFQTDAYLRTFQGVILQIDEKEDGALLVLNKTVFFPTGGGQPCDFGSLNGIPVLDVFEREGQIFHLVSRPHSFQPGDEVTGELDWDRRFRNMQRHCGEHILSGMFFSEYGGVNRGFHMGEDFMTIDISLEENPDFTTVTWEMALHAEFLANQAIWSDVPVTTRHFQNSQEASKLPLRKQLALEENITIVCVGSIDNPADCVACCGTHPKSAGAVGLIKVIKVESNKGMFRIYFKAGEDAFLDYREKHEILTRLNTRYSAATTDLLEKISIQDEKTKLLRNQHYQLKQLVLKERIQETELALAESAGITIREFTALQLDDLMHIGRSVTDKIKKLLLIVSMEESTVLLFSNGKTVNCGKLVKETVSIYNGKGGGNDSQARAIFPKAENIATYIDLLEKHLR